MPDYTLGDLLRDCWQGRYVLLACSAVMLAGAVAFCSLATPRYAISMTVGPSDKAAARDVTGIGGMSKPSAVQYAAKQAGLLREHNDYARYRALLTGHQVAKTLYKQNLQQARQIVRDAARPWRNIENKITPAHVSAALQKLIASRPTGRGEMREISMHYSDPAFARDVLERVHTAADSILRRQAGKKVDQRIAYLKNKLADTQHPDHRNVLTSLLMRQERTKMMISMDQAYAANMIAPPAATPAPVWPLPGIIVPVAGFVGLVLGYLGYMVYKVIAVRRPANTQTPQAGRDRLAPVNEIRTWSANE